MTAILALVFFSAAPSPITVQVRPEVVYIERAEAGQFINFDFVLTSHAKEDLTLGSIELSVLDRSGKLEARKLVNSDGERPSIDVIGAHVLHPEIPELIMNPFERLDARLDVSELVFEFKCYGKEEVYSARASVRPKVYASVAMDLPFRGRYLVWDGHDFYSHHRRFDFVSPTASQLGFRSNTLRYAYDFLALDKDGESHHGDPALNESWLAFGKPVYAAAEGTVVAVVDSRPDKRRLDVQLLKKDRMAMFGNYVVVRQRDGEFALYGHIRQGSAACKTGDKVQAGQKLAAIGAAGAASVPHLHFELQSAPDADGEGLPSIFRNFGRIDSGDIVEQAAAN